MTAARHAKYAPPAPLEAPPDLARLVAAHLACEPGREWGQTLLAVERWTWSRRVRMYQTFTVGTDYYVTLSDSLPRIGKIADSNWFETGKSTNER